MGNLDPAVQKDEIIDIFTSEERCKQEADAYVYYARELSNNNMQAAGLTALAQTVGGVVGGTVTSPTPCARQEHVATKPPPS